MQGQRLHTLELVFVVVGWEVPLKEPLLGTSISPIAKHLVIEGEKHPPVLDRERETEAEQGNGQQWQSPASS